MTIDKSKLQPLLWAVVGAWKAGEQDLQVHTDALDGFLGAHTVEEVALQLLAELNLAGEARDAYAADKMRLAFALNDARAEAKALRRLLAESGDELEELKRSVGFRGHTLEVLKKIDAALAEETSHG
ncbi:hypothetical protein MF6396_03080 [Pseudomonas sp. MF6396]|uniref:hypothetical protein n=1 Tax=Pseudomonas sp. MF6396 TaxID=1960828 RepID=UPI000997E072|nr:hypothetical protein [Pseudomonas sp. MF6396]OOW06646.1 hypothetical protein MF6396_03080 [Pseudomonas sp. MF6396]